MLPDCMSTMQCPTIEIDDYYDCEDEVSFKAITSNIYQLDKHMKMEHIPVKVFRQSQEAKTKMRLKMAETINTK